MTIKSIYPDICASDLTASRDFYTALVGLQVAWESDWYIVLNAPDADPGGMQLALVAAGHDSVPVDYQQPPAGVLISFEVDNATELYQNAVTNGLAVAQGLRDEDFGQATSWLSTLTGCWLTLSSCCSSRTKRRSSNDQVARPGGGRTDLSPEPAGGDDHRDRLGNPSVRLVHPTWDPDGRAGVMLTEGTSLKAVDVQARPVATLVYQQRDDKHLLTTVRASVIGARDFVVETEIEFSIGHFARLTRLTVRALRHYDDIGLLRPVRVDPRSGYRYYRPGQLKTATTIAVMRALDLDVPTIRGILTGTTDVTEIIAAERTRRQHDASQAEAALALLDHMDKPLWSDDHQPKVIEISPFQIVGRNLRVGSDDEYRVVAVAFEDLVSWDDQESIAHDQLHLTIGVRPETDMTGIGLPKGTVVVNIEGGPTAVALCRGPLQSLPVAHATLTDWVYNQQRQPNGSARETYLGSLDEQQTRIDIPLAP